MLTASLVDLHALLKARPALIVHFSGCPKGIGHTYSYPNDLQYAAANAGEIYCCSTIEPADFDASPVGASGCVGLVLAPLSPESVIYVDHQDHGAPPTTAARRAMDRPQSIADCARTFIRNGVTAYNEWLIGPSTVIGIFKAPKALVHLPNGDFPEVTADNILSDIGSLRMFSCFEGGFVERYGHGDWRPLDLNTIYP